MNNKKGFILEVTTLIVIQLSLIRAQEISAESEYGEENFRPPRRNLPPGFKVPSQTNQLQILESKISDLEETIKEMKSSSSVDTKNYKKRLNNLEAATEFLRKGVENLINKNNQNVPNLQYTIDDMTSAVDSARRELEGPNSVLRNEIIEDIKGRDFASASKKLRNLTGGLHKNINLIVQYVYANEEANFDKILQFGNSDHMNRTTKLIVYQALNYELENNRHSDYMNILKLIKSLNNVINQHLIISRELTAAYKLKQTLYVRVKDIIVTELISYMRTNNFRAVFKMSENIFLNYPVLFEEVISEAVKEAFDEVDTKKLVNFFSNHRYHEQRIFGLSAVFNELKSNNSLNQPLVVTLAMELKKALDAYIYITDYSAYDRGISLKNSLPESVKNLAFSKQVCIKNIESNEYLYAYNQGLRDKKNGNVFTWIPGKRVFQGVWSIEPTVDKEKFLIKNDRNNEYLYAYIYLESDNLYWTRVGTSALVNEQYFWTFQPNGNDTYIRNSFYHNEYMFIDTKKYGKNIEIGIQKKKSSLWLIENCNNYDYHHSVQPFQNASIMFQDYVQ